MTNTRYKNDSEKVRLLRALVDRGKEERKWQDVTTCAEAIQVKRSKIACMMNGDYSDGEMEPVIKKLKNVFATTGKKPMTELETLYQEGIRQKKWVSNTTCGEVIGVYRKTIGELLKIDPQTISAKRKPFLLEVIKKMKKALGQSSDAVQKPDPTDDLVAGRTHLPNQTVEGMRFILTAGNFQPIDVSFTEKEVKDTIQLIEEARRRIVLIAQTRNKDIRRILYQQLAVELDEFFLDAELISKVTPVGFVEKMEADRRTRSKFRGGHAAQ